MKNTDYELLIGQAEALIQGVPHLVANLERCLYEKYRL